MAISSYSKEWVEWEAPMLPMLCSSMSHTRFRHLVTRLSGNSRKNNQQPGYRVHMGETGFPGARGQVHSHMQNTKSVQG